MTDTMTNGKDWAASPPPPPEATTAEEVDAAYASDLAWFQDRATKVPVAQVVQELCGRVAKVRAVLIAANANTARQRARADNARGKALEEAADECRALRNSEYAFLSQDRQLALAFAEKRIRSLIGTAPQKEKAAPSPQGSETKGAHKVLHGHAYAADDYNEPAICPKCKLLISTTQSARFVCRFRAECAGLAASVPTREGAE